MPAFPGLHAKQNSEIVQDQAEVEAHEIDVGSLPRRLATENEHDNSDPAMYENQFADGE